MKGGLCAIKQNVKKKKKLEEGTREMCLSQRVACGGVWMWVYYLALEILSNWSIGQEVQGKMVRQYQVYPFNVKPALVFPSPEEDDVKADIITVLQSPSTGQRTVGEKNHSISNQKIRNTRALPADVTVLQINGK